MKPQLQLDFIAPPARRWAVACGLAALACALAGLGLVWQVQSVQQRIEALQARLGAQVRRSAAQAPSAAPVLTAAQAERQLARANQVIDQLAIPWGDLLHAFEAAESPGVGLLTLVPNGSEGSVHLGGEAASLPRLLAYVESLAAQPVLEQVHLLGYETVEREGRTVVSFTMAARWHKRS